jgi:membrane associated rhomboid family serine protease
MFFAFPLNSKPDWRNPPWLTLLLIFVNCVVYFGFQRSEEHGWDKAAAYYTETDLPRLEVPRYVEILKRSDAADDRRLVEYIERDTKGRAIAGLIRHMEQDRRFQNEVRADRIVAADDPDYARWRVQRTRFEQLKPTPFTNRWASNPADWQPITLITAAFLHVSVGHLLGNMVFLFVFGYTVELALGRSRYLLFYLLAGCAGEVGDLIARWGSQSIGLGASGAISGLMAMYAMIYGRRRIRFFYQLMFYFDYVKAPAIILLPAWIAHEFLQQWLNPDGGVAYMAHAGGLIGGALLLAVHKRLRGAAFALPEEEPAEDNLDADRRRTDDLIRAMKLAEARALLGSLVERRPTDRDLLFKYFGLTRLAPDDEHFHRAAQRIFALDGDDPATMQGLHDSFESYWTTAKPRPRLNVDQMARLAIRFARAGHLASADRLSKLLLAQAPEHQALPSVLLGLVRASLARNDREKATEHGRTLANRYGQSAEARLAAELIA